MVDSITIVAGWETRPSIAILVAPVFDQNITAVSSSKDWSIVFVAYDCVGGLNKSHFLFEIDWEKKTFLFFIRNILTILRGLPS